MAIPSRYRAAVEAMGGVMVATIDLQDKCLLLYSMSEWEELEEKIASLPSLNKSARRFQRLLIGNSREVSMDGNGRFLIPPELREYAELEKSVVLVGQRHRFELWSESNWNAGREEWLEAAAVDEEMPEEMLSLTL